MPRVFERDSHPPAVPVPARSPINRRLRRCFSSAARQAAATTTIAPRIGRAVARRVSAMVAARSAATRPPLLVAQEAREIGARLLALGHLRSDRDAHQGASRRSPPLAQATACGPRSPPASPIRRRGRMSRASLKQRGNPKASVVSRLGLCWPICAMRAWKHIALKPCPPPAPSWLDPVVELRVALWT